MKKERHPIFWLILFFLLILLALGVLLLLRGLKEGPNIAEFLQSIPV